MYQMSDAFRGIQVTDCKWENCGKINVSFIIFKLSLGLGIWTCGEMGKMLKVHWWGTAGEAGLGWNLEGLMRVSVAGVFHSAKLRSLDFIIHLVHVIFINLVNIYGGATTWQVTSQTLTGSTKMWFLLSKFRHCLERNIQKNHFQTLPTWLNFRRPIGRYTRKLYYGIHAFYLSLLNSDLTSMGHAPAACGYGWSNTDIKHKYHKAWLPPV